LPKVKKYSQLLLIFTAYRNITLIGQEKFLVRYSTIGSLSIYYPDEELGIPLAKKTFMGYI